MFAVATLLLAFSIQIQTAPTVTPISQALRMVPREGTMTFTSTRVTVSGVITYILPSDNSDLECFIQDGTGGIELFRRGYPGPTLGVGDSVVATGTLALYFGQEEMRSPDITVLRRGATVAPVQATLKQVREGEFHGRLMHAEGKVVGRSRNGGGVVIYLTDQTKDTAGVFIDNRLLNRFDLDRIRTGETVSATGVGTRYSTMKPYTDNNDISIPSPSDIYPINVGFLVESSGVILTVLVIIVGIVVLLLVFNLLLRSEVRQKTRLIEEQSRLSGLLYDGIAELSGLLDRDEIVERIILKLYPHIGMTSAIFCSAAGPAHELTFQSFVLTSGRVKPGVATLDGAPLMSLVGQTTSEDIIWNKRVSDFLSKAGALRESDALGFISKFFHDRQITIVRGLEGDPVSLIIFDHKTPFVGKVQRESMLTFVRHLVAAMRGAELFALTQKQEKAIEKLYNSSVFGLLTLSLDGTIESANLVASEMLNDTPLVGNKLQQYLSSEDRARMDELLPSLAAAGTENFVRFDARINQGAAAPSEVEFAVEYESESGTFNVSVQDIGDRRMFDEYTAYEQKIASLEKMASFLSHDLNNIVGSITGYASLLKRKLPPESKEYHYSDIIEDAGRRTTELVRQVLGFAQMDAKSIEVVDLNEFIKGVADEFAKLHDSEYSLVTECAGQPVYSRISTSQFRQVLIAILENAADSMETGGTIKCSTGFSDLQGGRPASGNGGGRRCYVEIEDHGIGMDDAIKRRIFEPFFTTKRMKKYTGLSLTAAYNIVKHHKGFITVDSEPGAGTRMRIYLPRYSDQDKPKIDSSSQEIVSTDGFKILVVDDEESVRQLGHDILSEHGFDVVTAANGREALDRLRENPEVKLVVLDMVMPVMGGKEACIEIKKLPSPPKVLICTGFSQLSDLEPILGTYADGLLPKPYRTGDLLKSVSDLLREATGNQPGE